MQARLGRSDGGDAVQAFPLQQGLVNLENAAGAITNVKIIHCVDAGNLTITWSAGVTSTIACLAGNDYTVIGAYSCTVATGKFHFAR